MGKKKITREQVVDFLATANEDDAARLQRLCTARVEEWRAHSRVQMARADLLEEYEEPF